MTPHTPYRVAQKLHCITLLATLTVHDGFAQEPPPAAPSARLLEKDGFVGISASGDLKAAHLDIRRHPLSDFRYANYDVMEPVEHPSGVLLVPHDGPELQARQSSRPMDAPSEPTKVVRASFSIQDGQSKKLIDWLAARYGPPTAVDLDGTPGVVKGRSLQWATSCVALTVVAAVQMSEVEPDKLKLLTVVGWEPNCPAPAAQ